MKKHWFKPFGWIYMPTSWRGFVFTTALAVFCLNVFLAVDMDSHSVADTMYGVFPYVVPAVGIWLWVAGKTSKQGK